MNRLILLAFALFGFSLAEEIKARVNLTDYGSDDAGKPGGYLNIVQKDGKLTITGVVHNLTPAGLHGFHVHEKGSIGNKCIEAGPHYNPLSKTHGSPSDSNRHIGDLGNIQADSNGEAKITITDSIALLNGDYSILDRTIVIHKQADDLGKGNTKDSNTTGNAGARVQCGIIQQTNAAISSSLSVLCLAFGLMLYSLQRY